MGKPRRWNSYDSAVRTARKEAETYGQIRQDKSSIRSSFRDSPTGIPQGQGHAKSDADRLSTIFGGVLDAPIAFTPETDDIESGALDISTNSAGDQKNPRGKIYIVPESGTTDTLNTISPKVYTEQLLILSGVDGNTITITHNSGGAGSILCPNDQDFTLSDDETIILQDDSTAATQTWRIIAGSQVGGGGSGSGGTSDYLYAIYTANATVVDPLPLPTAVTSSSGTTITMNSPTTNRIRLTAGNTYRLTAHLAGRTVSSDDFTYQWYDDVAAANIGTRGNTTGTLVAAASRLEGHDTAYAVVTPTTTRDYRIKSIGGAGGQITTDFSYIYVERLSTGGVSFPIRPPITTISSPTSTQDLDLNTEEGHVFKITADKDFTLTFSNPPTSGTQHTFEIELTNDSTSTARTVTLPSSVRQLSSITVPATTPAARGVYTLRVNDATNYDIIEVVSGTSGSGFSGNLSDITVDTDFDADGTHKFILDADADTYIIGDTDDRIEFFTGNTEKVRIDTNLQLQGGVNADINGNDVILDVDDDTYIHSSGDDNFQLFVGGTNKLQVNTSQATFFDNVSLNNNSLDGISVLNFNTTGQSVTTSASGLTTEVPTGDVHLYTINGANKLEINNNDVEILNANLDVNANSIDNVFDINGASSGSITNQTTGWEHNVDSGDSHKFKVATTDIVTIDATNGLSMNQGDDIDLVGGDIDNVDTITYDERGTDAPTPAATEGTTYFYDNAGTQEYRVRFGNGTVKTITDDT
jgi:hypothetical protein